MADFRFKRHLSTSAEPPEVVSGLVGRDREEPGLESPLEIERTGRMMDLKEGLLHHILGGGVSGEPVDELVQFPTVAAYEQLKAGSVACQVLAKELFVRWRVHCPIVCFCFRHRYGSREHAGGLRLRRFMDEYRVFPCPGRWIEMSCQTHDRFLHRRKRAEASTGCVAVGGLLLIVAIALETTAGSGVQPERDPVLAVASPRVVVMKSSRVLHLFDGESLVRTYAIDLGVAPLGPKRRREDGRTPEGRFRAVIKKADSPYHRFIGIDYPDLPTTQWGLERGLVSPGEAAAIRRALADQRCPDWGTGLGGGIGIHGRRVGRDWTGGCIALSDEHIEELFSVLRIGDPVEILP